jgi:hypothetical protein
MYGEQMSKFPLCTQAGLKVMTVTTTWPFASGTLRPDHSDITYVLASEVEAMLAKGQQVWCVENIEKNGVKKIIPWKEAGQTHQALLINIKPIGKPDAAESLLRELIKTSETESISHIVYRARKLLDKGEK